MSLDIESVPNSACGTKNDKHSFKPPILIVDDEPEVLASLRSLFRREYKVLTAERGEQALDILRTGAEVHVIITDQRMPGMTGVELLSRVREEFPDVIRLMMTGYSDVNSVVNAVNEGSVYRYIGKPWDPDELSAVIRQAFERYRLVGERRILLRELEEANRLKASFITLASHEFNTPLTIVLGMLRLAQSKNADDAVKPFLDRALVAAERLHRRLVNTFKVLEHGDFSRTLNLKPTSVQVVVDEAAQEMAPLLKIRKQSLLTRIEPVDLLVTGSHSHLRDVLEALLSNAMKFSKDESSIRLSAVKDGECAIIEVEDHGTGICAADQPHVFEPMFSTLDMLKHSTGEYGYCKRGMGLGLAIAKRFVELQHGEITFSSDPSRGTIFRIRLPLAARSPIPVNGDTSF
jgi:signal transduction histidine kinase